MPKSDETPVELIRSALTAIDGLWFLEVEKELGFEKAFELDLNVWKRYGPIIIKRIKKSFAIEEENMDSFLKVLSIICSIDGTRFKIKEKSITHALLQIIYCPWWENLKRSNRETLVRCDLVDNTIFPIWAKSFNRALRFELTKSLPEGNPYCEWQITLK